MNNYTFHSIDPYNYFITKPKCVAFFRVSHFSDFAWFLQRPLLNRITVVQVSKWYCCIMFCTTDDQSCLDILDNDLYHLGSRDTSVILVTKQQQKLKCSYFRFNVLYAMYFYNTLSHVIASRSNNPEKSISPHLDTLLWFLVDQLKDTCRTLRKVQGIRQAVAKTRGLLFENW